MDFGNDWFVVMKDWYEFLCVGLYEFVILYGILWYGLGCFFGFVFFGVVSEIIFGVKCGVVVGENNCVDVGICLGLEYCFFD